MYLKRQNIARFWPVPRKGTKYLTVAAHEKGRGIPLAVVMRDVLKLVKSKKELRVLINGKKILINGRVARSVKHPILLFDAISFPEIKRHYRAVLKGKKIGFEEEKEAVFKICKIIGKRQLKGEKIQLNLSDGRNMMLSKKDGAGIRTKDFVVLNCVNNKIEKVIPLQRGVNVIAIKGKHIGARGKVLEIGRAGTAKIATENRGEIEVSTKNLFATGGKD